MGVNCESNGDVLSQGELVIALRASGGIFCYAVTLGLQLTHPCLLYKFESTLDSSLLFVHSIFRPFFLLFFFPSGAYIEALLGERATVPVQSDRTYNTI